MSLNKQKHVRYWRMCANILPGAYQSNDASRMSLGFFMLSALDLLQVLHEPESSRPIITLDERRNWIQWIYDCQLPGGKGFRGFPGTDLRDHRKPENSVWDPANLPNTFFALAALLVLNDDLGRVNRDALLDWLPLLQRADGSFGELLGQNDRIEGGRDLRYCCCAAGIAFVLKGHGLAESEYCPFDIGKLIDYIQNCQSFEGGFGESPLREPHSGLNYCAVATLDLVSRLQSKESARARQVLESIKDTNVGWLLARQTTFIEEDVGESEDADIDQEAKQEATNADLNEDWCVVGFNGRTNKMADTCYCFWNSGALGVLKSLHFASTLAVRRYLLEKVQHIIGGFAKDTVSPPDILHAYLGLATLSLYGEAGVGSLDAALCMSTRAVANLSHVSWNSSKAPAQAS